MLKPLGIFLFSLFIYSQVYNTWAWVNYELHIEEITEEYCENTDKPDMDCHGKCHLKKQIIQTTPPATEQSSQVIYINEIQLFSDLTNIIIPTSNIKPLAHQTGIDANYAFLRTFGIFHPPQA